MAKILKPLCLGFAVACVSGCATDTNGLWNILTGVMAWSGQKWDVSASAFLDTASRASASGDRTLRDYAVFGLASTYLAQDEYDSALARLSEIENADSPEIRSGVWYQAGIIAFRRGEFQSAADCFRKSLENDPSSLDAKINLELSRQSLVERRSDRSSGASGIREEKEAGRDSEALFNLVRKKEQDRWKNQSDEGRPSSVADY